MKGAEVLDPLFPIEIGRSIDDTVVYAGKLVQKFCDEDTDCVALDELGEPNCYAQGVLYDVDDFSGSGQSEICDSAGNNVWCPEGFVYREQVDQCIIPEDTCYDEADTSMCNLRERDNIFTQAQYLDWLTDLDSCSNYAEGQGELQSCCFVAEIHGTIYQYDQTACIYPGDGSPAVDSNGNPC